MKVSDLNDEWDNLPPHGKGYIQYLRKKINAIDHQIEVLSYKSDNELLTPDERRNIASKQTTLGHKRLAIKGLQTKAILNMKNVIHDAELAVRHAKVVNRRMPEAEEAIMTNPKAALEYAIYVLRDRWPEAEEAIKKDPEIWKLYKSQFNI